MLDFEPSVHGDRMVDGRQHGQLLALLHEQETPSQALVVVHQVELAPSALEVLPGPQGKGHGLGEVAGVERHRLGDVPLRLHLPDTRLSHREVVVEQLEAGKGDEVDPLVEHGVRGPGEDLDVMAEVDERLGEMAGVDALATAVGLAAVRQIGDAKRIVGPRGRGGVFRHPTSLAAVFGEPSTGRRASGHPGAGRTTAGGSGNGPPT